MTDNVLQEAEALIFGDREDTYGDPSESFARIANLWTAYIGKLVDPQDVANLMILLKVSRTKGTYHRDSYVDIGGYAGLAERLHKVDNTPAPAEEPKYSWQYLNDECIPPEIYTVYDKNGDQWLSFGDRKYWARSKDGVRGSEVPSSETAPFSVVARP